jgi:transcription elongation GreA/GreB family factor
MELTLGTGIFWLLLASTVGETIVRTARALRRRGERADAAAEATAALEQRVRELEARLEQQLALHADQAATIMRLEDQVEFTERLLTGRAEPDPRHLPS